jgi:predicted ATP-grasp superfamily ATP-dependent carboligase
MKILILSGGLQGLSCGSSLYKHHEVSIVATDLQVRKSRFFQRVYEIEKVDEKIYPILKEGKFDVLIPVSDFSVPFLSKNKDYIEKTFGVKCAVPDYRCVSVVENKQRFMAFCQEKSLSHPVTEPLSSDELNSVAAKVGFPALIKPNFSVGARGITRVDSLEELQEMFPVVQEKYGLCTLQEYIDNQEYYYNVMMCRSADGHILGTAVIKIVRMYPVKAGSSSCAITVECPELELLCRQTLDALDWVGMADFDVLQRLDNGAFKIIEINSRVPASLRAAEVSGVNFPLIIANDAMGIAQMPVHCQAGKTLRYLGIDILWLLKTKRLFGHPSWLKFVGRDLYYQDIYATDPTTWWTWLAEGLQKLGTRNKRLR